MKEFIIKHVFSLFTGADLKPGQLKVFLSLIVSVMFWLTVSQNNLSKQLGELKDNTNYLPQMVEQKNRELAQMLYTDAQHYSMKVIECIIKANTDILIELDISEVERTKAIRAIEARFEGVTNQIEHLQKEQKYIRKTQVYKKHLADSLKIGFMPIGALDRFRPVTVPRPRQMRAYTCRG